MAFGKGDPMSSITRAFLRAQKRRSQDLTVATEREMLRELLRSRGGATLDNGMGASVATARLPMGHPDYDWSRDLVLKALAESLLVALRPTRSEYHKHVRQILWAVDKLRPGDLATARLMVSDYCDDVLIGRIPGSPRQARVMI